MRLPCSQGLLCTVVKQAAEFMAVMLEWRCVFDASIAALLLHLKQRWSSPALPTGFRRAAALTAISCGSLLPPLISFVLQGSGGVHPQAGARAQP